MQENIKIFLQDIFKIILLVSIIVLSIYYQKNIYPFGNETIAYGDMVQQTIPENFTCVLNTPCTLISAPDSSAIKKPIIGYPLRFCPQHPGLFPANSISND